MPANTTISFARGAPSLDIVDVEGLREAEQHAVAVEQVLVTNGSMQADAFLFELMVNPGDAVIVESPTYDRTLLNLRNRGADVRMVDLETDGISIEGLEEVLATAVHPKLAHIIPNFQNPAGYTLSAEKRKRLLELAVEHDFTIFEDDPYVAIRFEGKPIASMFSHDEAGRVVYASSFSKTVCPGIRVGYLVGPQAIVKQIQTIATNTYISPNMVAQSIVNAFARSGRMDGAIATVKSALRERRDTLVAALERELPEARFTPPQGGYFMWVELPEGVKVAELEAAASERGVVFVKGTDFLLEGGENTLRLAYSGVTPEQIDEGISRLAEAVRSLGVAA